MADVLRVYQDGAQFYCDEVHGELWEAPFKVMDWDMKAAQEARLLFLSWANVAGLRVEFEQ